MGQVLQAAKQILAGKRPAPGDSGAGRRMSRDPGVARFAAALVPCTRNNQAFSASLPCRRLPCTSRRAVQNTGGWGVGGGEGPRAESGAGLDAVGVPKPVSGRPCGPERRIGLLQPHCEMPLPACGKGVIRGGRGTSLGNTWALAALGTVLAAVLPAVVTGLLATRQLRRIEQSRGSERQTEDVGIQRLHDFIRWTNTGAAAYVLVAAALAVSFEGPWARAAFSAVPSAFRGFVGATLGLVWVFAVLLGVHAARQPFVRALRQVEATPREETALTIRFLALMFVPMGLWFGLYSLISASRWPLLRSDWTVLAVAVLFAVLVASAAPAIVPKLLRAVPCEDPELKARVGRLTATAGLTLGGVYLIPWSRHRVANAMVTGYRMPSVFLSDYLVANFTPAEVDAVVAHELGHVHHRHLLVRGALAVLWIPLWVGFGTLLDRLPAPASPIVLLGVLVGAMALYHQVFLTWLSRRFEEQADRYAVSLGVNVDAYIGALEKLSQLNRTPRRWRRGEALFRTHPDVARRIDLLRQPGRRSEVSRPGGVSPVDGADT